MVRVQNRYVKMELGLNRNTPDYVWKMEAERSSLEIGNSKRASSYLLEIGKMGENRRPRVCLKEDVRWIKTETQQNGAKR